MAVDLRVPEDQKTMTEEIIGGDRGLIEECRAEARVCEDKISNYWEGEYHLIMLDRVTYVGKKYPEEIVVFLKDVPPQVYPLIKGEEDVNSFMDKLKAYREKYENRSNKVGSTY
jgi:hypothetical protein